MRKRGNRGGARVPAEKEQAILELRHNTIYGINKIARMCGVGTGTVVRVIKDNTTRAKLNRRIKP